MNKRRKAMIRGIFARFENLNLLFLIEDLRRGLVASDGWIRYEDGGDFIYKVTCPLAHGWKGDIGNVCDDTCESNHEDRMFCLHAGVTLRTGKAFYNWWDNGSDCYTERGELGLKQRKAALIAILGEIYAERLADADAVQGVIAEACEEERDLQIDAALVEN